MKRNGRIRTFTCRLAVLLLAMMLAFLTAVPASAAGTSTKSGTQSGTQSSGPSGTQSSSSKSTSKKDERKIIKAEEDGKTVLYFETDPDWKIRYSEEITDELVETEMAIFSVFPIQFVRQEATDIDAFCKLVTRNFQQNFFHQQNHIIKSFL